MKVSSRVAAALVAALSLAPTLVAPQSVTLSPGSASLVTIPATSADLLSMSVPVGPVPGPLPPAVVGRTAASLGLLAGDVVDALTHLDDGIPGVDTLYFSVDAGAVAFAGPFPPDVVTATTAVLPG